MIDPEKTRVSQVHLISIVRCNGHSAFGNACGSPANTKKVSEALAGLPQTPKRFPRDLRDSRKGQKVSRETCGTPANAKKFSVGLAGLPQRPKSFSRDLRDSRKHQKVSRETWGTPANTSKKFLGFAAFLQKRFSPFWRLQDFCKSAFLHFGVYRTLPLYTSQISGDLRAYRCRSVGEIRLFLPIFY